MEYRFYSFVANHYLSQLQCGLQTAHAVAEMSLRQFTGGAYAQWAEVDKTIIICGASNHSGVCNVYNTITEMNNQYPEIDLPVVLFNEDNQSMNGMATACGVLVPDRLYTQGEDFSFYADLTTAEYTMACYLKSFRLA